MSAPVTEQDIKRLEGKVILVTGASGFIGTHLVARLSQVPDVRLLLLCNQEQAPQPHVEIHVGRLEALSPDYWQTRGIGHIDCIFHLGAFTPKSRDEANHWVAAVRDNINGTQQLLLSLPSYKRFIFASTLDVYAPPKPEECLNESSQTDSTKAYAASKLFCEEMIRSYCLEQGRECAILRYGHIYGPGEGKYRKVIPNTIQRILKNEPVIPSGDPNLLRDYLYVGDLIEATLRAAVSQEPILGPINVVKGESVPIGHVMNTLERLFNRACTSEFFPHLPAKGSLRFDNRLMKEKLGMWNMISLEEGLRQEIEDFRRDESK